MSTSIAFRIGAIDSVQILKDGGSAVYGTDAVAGVVNFITKNDYTGADIYNYYGISQRGDYEVYHGEFTGGWVQKLATRRRSVSSQRSITTRKVRSTQSTGAIPF